MTRPFFAGVAVSPLSFATLETNRLPMQLLPPDPTVFRYLSRLKLGWNPQASPLTFLDEVNLRHSLTVPFENLDILLGNVPSLSSESLFEKIVCRKRGGYCYELNGLLYYVLRKLGYEVELLSARILFGAQGVFARGHKLLLVTVDSEKWLVDVGYRNGLLRPLRLALDTEQQQCSETFRLINTNSLFVLQKRIKEEWMDLYSFTLDPQLPVDFEPHNFYNARCTNSIFTRMRIVSLKTREGSLSLLNNVLVEMGNGKRIETPVSSASDYNDLLQSLFGICLREDDVNKLYALGE